MESIVKSLKELYENYQDDFIAPGNAGCPGCGAVLTARMIMKVLGEKTWSV